MTGNNPADTSMRATESFAVDFISMREEGEERRGEARERRGGRREGERQGGEGGRRGREEEGGEGGKVGWARK